MASRDIYTNVDAVTDVSAAVITSDTTATTVDMRGYESVVFVIDVGTAGDTLSATTKFDFKLTESSDDSTFTAVSDANDVIGATPDTNGTVLTVDADGEAGTVYQRGYVGGERYLKLNIDVTGTHSNGTPISIVAIKGHKYTAGE